MKNWLHLFGKRRMNRQEQVPGRNELEKKAWYRFFKLCYGFGYVVSLTIAVAIGYSEFPVEYTDSDKSIIRCANGKEYPASTISSYVNAALYLGTDEKARKLCEEPAQGEEIVGVELPDGRTVGVALPRGADPKIAIPRAVARIMAKDKNYTFIAVKAIRGSYETLFWGLGIVIFLGELIRRSFLYVVVGKPFFHGFTFIKRGF